MKNQNRPFFNLACFMTQEDEPAFSLKNEVATRLFDIQEQLDYGTNHGAFVRYNDILNYLEKKEFENFDNTDYLNKITDIRNIISGYQKYILIESISNN